MAGLFASALREEVEARGRLSESEGPSLSGELLAVRSGPSAINAAGALAFRLDADVILRVVEGAGNVPYEDRATFGEDYLVGVDVLGTEANRRAALRRLAKAASRELMTRYEIAVNLDGPIHLIANGLGRAPHSFEYLRERRKRLDEAAADGRRLYMPTGSTIHKRFGSWNKALEAAGLETVEHGSRIPKYPVVGPRPIEPFL